MGKWNFSANKQTSSNIKESRRGDASDIYKKGILDTRITISRIVESSSTSKDVENETTAKRNELAVSCG